MTDSDDKRRTDIRNNSDLRFEENSIPLYIPDVDEFQRTTVQHFVIDTKRIMILPLKFVKLAPYFENLEESDLKQLDVQDILACIPRELRLLTLAFLRTRERQKAGENETATALSTVTSTTIIENQLSLQGKFRSSIWKPLHEDDRIDASNFSQFLTEHYAPDRLAQFTVLDLSGNGLMAADLLSICPAIPRLLPSVERVILTSNYLSLSGQRETGAEVDDVRRVIDGFLGESTAMKYFVITGTSLATLEFKLLFEYTSEDSLRKLIWVPEAFVFGFSWHLLLKDRPHISGRLLDDITAAHASYYGLPPKSRSAPIESTCTTYVLIMGHNVTFSLFVYAPGHRVCHSSYLDVDNRRYATAEVEV